MSLAICTPVYGASHTANISIGYLEAIYPLRDAQIHGPHFFTNTDLVRARSRAVAIAYEMKVDHLLFWDADVYAPAEQIATVIRGMLASGHDLVAAQYMKRGTSREIAAHGVESERVGNCVRAQYVAMGFTLLSRSLITRMLDVYSDLWFHDSHHGADGRSVALFQLIIDEERTLLGEDASFCYRAARAGFQPWLYVGDGALLQHAGVRAQ